MVFLALLISEFLFKKSERQTDMAILTRFVVLIQSILILYCVI